MPRKKQYEEVAYYSLSPETKRGIFIVFLFIVAILCVLSFLGLAGRAGFYIDWGLGIVFGWGRFFLPLVLIILGYVLARPAHYQISWPNYIGIVLFFLSIHGLLHSLLPVSNSFELTFSGLGGGIVGYLITYPLNLYVGFWATLLVLVGVFLVAVLLMFNTSIESLIEKSNVFKYFAKQPTEAEAEDAEEEAPAESQSEETAMQTEETDTKVNDVKFTAKSLIAPKEPETHPSIRTPKVKVDLPINLLDDKKSKPTSGDIKVGLEKIQKTLENFHIPVEMGEVQVGPTVTQYTLKPSEGIKLSRITALNNDLALAMAAHPIRIEAPIPGKSLVGIEVPNQKPAVVRIREILDTPEFKNRKTNITIALGKDVSGKAWVDDIGHMPHLLVAGATGSGKSVCLNAIIISLLYENNPDTLRMILVDPKRVEFPVYNGIPHLLTPVITDVTKTVYALRWAISEMDRRFDTLQKAKKRNLESYNLATKEKMPHIIIIIDELADLMVAAAAEVEACIIRLTQMARAVGIHLVVATQRPSVDVITGLIKANIPCRIAFSVASLMDSRTILDTSGAEKLVGKGDMLFMTPTTAKPRRLQGAYVSDDEIKRVVDFLRHAAGEPDYQTEITDKAATSGSTSFDFNGGGDSDDDLFDEAKKLVIESGKASASYLQRRLRIGYARAARLIDLMEEAGIVGPGDGAKPRDILVDKVSALAHSGILNQSSNDEITDEEPANVLDFGEDKESDTPVIFKAAVASNEASAESISNNTKTEKEELDDDSAEESDEPDDEPEKETPGSVKIAPPKKTAPIVEDDDSDSKIATAKPARKTEEDEIY